MNNSRQIIYWLLVLLLSYGPVIGFHLLIRPSWFKEIQDSTMATLIETFFVIVFLPIYLVLANYFLTRKFQKISDAFILNAVIILSCIFISTHLHFKNWADSGGNYDHPDSETVALMDFERLAGCTLCCIGFLIIYFIHRRKGKMKSTS